MERLRLLLSIAGVTLLTLALAAVPAVATEATGGEGESDKFELPVTQHDRVGLILIIICVIIMLFVLDNARRQLRGERKQASGEFRWR